MIFGIVELIQSVFRLLAEQTLAAFGAMVREEVYLNRLKNHLLVSVPMAL